MSEPDYFGWVEETEWFEERKSMSKPTGPSKEALAFCDKFWTEFDAKADELDSREELVAWSAEKFDRHFAELRANAERLKKLAFSVDAKRERFEIENQRLQAENEALRILLRCDCPMGHELMRFGSNAELVRKAMRQESHNSACTIRQALAQQEPNDDA